MTEKIAIKRIVENDLPNVVKIHERAFKSFFLTTLGSSFLLTYYTAVLKTTNSIVVGAYLDKRLVGFGIGAVVANGFNKKLLLNNFFSFGWETLKILYRNPRAILQLKKNFTKIGDVEDTGKYSELFSIAVDPSENARGIGSVLISSFEENAKKRGAKEISLTTDFFDNEKTLFFYQKNGYKPFYEFMAYPDRKMYRLIKQI